MWYAWFESVAQTKVHDLKADSCSGDPIAWAECDPSWTQWTSNSHHQVSHRKWTIVCLQSTPTLSLHSRILPRNIHPWIHILPSTSRSFSLLDDGSVTIPSMAEVPSSTQCLCRVATGQWLLSFQIYHLQILLNIIANQSLTFKAVVICWRIID